MPVHKPNGRSTSSAVERPVGRKPLADRDTVIAVNRIILAGMIRRLPIINDVSNSEANEEQQRGCTF